jgi:hypothetical protein
MDCLTIDPVTIITTTELASVEWCLVTNTNAPTKTAASRAASNPKHSIEPQFISSDAHAQIT